MVTFAQMDKPSKILDYLYLVRNVSASKAARGFTRQTVWKGLFVLESINGRKRLFTEML